MSSGGKEYVYTHPVPRSTSKLDTGKNSCSWGQLNSNLPFSVLMGSLTFIRSLMRVLLKSSAYQSIPISPCLLMYSMRFPSSVLVSSTVGFMAAFCWSKFSVMCSGVTTGLSLFYLCLLVVWLILCFLLCALGVCHGPGLDFQPVLCHPCCMYTKCSLLYC